MRIADKPPANIMIEGNDIFLVESDVNENAEDKNDEAKWYPWVSEAMKYSEKNNHFYSKSDLLTADGDPVIVNYYWDKQLGKKPKRYEEQKEAMAKLNGFTC